MKVRGFTAYFCGSSGIWSVHEPPTLPFKTRLCKLDRAAFAVDPVASKGAKCVTEIPGDKNKEVKWGTKFTHLQNLGSSAWKSSRPMLPLGHPVPQFDVSVPEQLLKIVAILEAIYLAWNSQNRLPFGGRAPPGPAGELKRSPVLPP